MLSHRRRERAIAIGLTALSGYVDALGFLALGGYFVSFMSGNSTRLGVGTQVGWWHATLPAALIALFVAGVMLGTWVGRRGGPQRRSRVLTFVSLLLLLAAAAASLASPAHLAWPGLQRAAIACMVLAMGAENTIFERNGEVTLGLTYMTGTLVKLGQRAMLALMGGDGSGWLWYLSIWLGLILGTALGAAAYSAVGLQALWPAAAMALLATLAMRRMPDTTAQKTS